MQSNRATQRENDRDSSDTPKHVRDASELDRRSQGGRRSAPTLPFRNPRAVSFVYIDGRSDTGNFETLPPCSGRKVFCGFNGFGLSFQGLLTGLAAGRVRPNGGFNK